MSRRVHVVVVDESAKVAAAAAAPVGPGYKRKPSPPNAKVYFIGLTAGTVLSLHPTLRFGLTGMWRRPESRGRIPGIITF